MYIAKKYFTDLQDNEHPYQPGDIYPREGLEPSPDRIKELSTESNIRGEVLITEVKDEPKTTAAPKKKAPARKTVKKTQ